MGGQEAVCCGSTVVRGQDNEGELWLCHKHRLRDGCRLYGGKLGGRLGRHIPWDGCSIEHLHMSFSSMEHLC